MSNLVSTEWLAAHLKDVRVVDASWYMPGEKRHPAGEFEVAHIPGAVFFDIDGIAGHATDLPHMMPAPGEFSKAVGDLGPMATLSTSRPKRLDNTSRNIGMVCRRTFPTNTVALTNPFSTH